MLNSSHYKIGLIFGAIFGSLFVASRMARGAVCCARSSLCKKLLKLSEQSRLILNNYVVLRR